MATYGVIHPKHIFGINEHCKGKNLFCLDAKTIAYPAGNTIVLYNLPNKTQQFLHGVEKVRGVTAFTVSNTKVYAAVAQVGDGETPISIAIFDLILNKRKKTLINGDIRAKEYISLSFSSDSLNLASLVGSPDYIVYLWKWDKSRLLCQAKTTGFSGPMHAVTASPIDQSVFCALGKGTFRFFRYNEGHLKPFGYQKGENFHFLCHAWLGKGERIIVGTSEGSLLFFDKHDFRFDMEIPMIESQESNLTSAAETAHAMLKNIGSYFTNNLSETIGSSQETLGSSAAIPETTTSGREVTAAVGYSKGFIVAFGPGHVIVYEEQEEFDIPEDQYKPVYFLRIPSFTSKQSDRTVQTLAVNATEEMLMATTISGQLFHFLLATVEIKDPSEMIFETLSCSFHSGPVLGMDVASRKTIFVTIGADKFIRVWNYVKLCLEVAKEFSEEIHSVAIHPTGLYIVAGFVDKIRMFSILMSDIRELKDFNIRGCGALSFSNGGHLFAAVNGSIILVYKAMSYELVWSLKGHSNKVRSLKWTPDDTGLVSVGKDGAIYQWDVALGQREYDFVERGSNMMDVGISPDAKIHFAISGSKLLKEIQIQDGIMIRQVELGMEPRCITIAHSNQVLIAGLLDGVARTFKQPIGTVNDWFDFRMHQNAINSIQITFDEGHCISVSDDGSIIIWKLTDSDGRVCKSDKEIYFSNEVLVPKSELEERDFALKELKQKFVELKLEMEYQTRRKEVSHIEEIKAMTSKFNLENSKLDNQLSELMETIKEHDELYEERTEQMNQDANDTALNVEAHYNTRLIGEYEKYNALQSLLDETVTDYEERITKMDEDRNTAVGELLTYFDAQLKIKTDALQEAYMETRQISHENEELKNIIEEDGEDEIHTRKISYDEKIQMELELNAKFKADANIMKKNFVAMQREIDDQKAEVGRLVAEAEKTKTWITITEKEVSTLRKDLLDRDVNVQGKEKAIFDLKKTNNELEKYKFILDYKIKELKKMIEPRQREIAYLKQRNDNMEEELETTLAFRTGLDLQVSELSMKLRKSEGEYQIQKRMRWKLEILLLRVRSSMSRCMGLLQDHQALKEITQQMYHQFARSYKVVQSTPAEHEAICELVRQKNHLEMCIASMKRKMSKDAEFARSEQLKIMSENMVLVLEINALRKELKQVRAHIQKYETGFGVNVAQSSSDQIEMKLKLCSAVADLDEITLEHIKQLDAKEDIIQGQQGEIKGLSTRIAKVQEFVNATYLSEVGPGASVDLLKQILSDTST